MSRRRRSRTLVVVISVVMLLILGEAALVVAVFVSPSTGEHLQSVAAAADRSWNGTKHAKGVKDRLTRVVHRGYQDWVASMWTQPANPAPNGEFARCVKCHADYAQTRRFSTVYMNHPLHAELGVACSTCHQQNQHPDPMRPTEDTCKTCHAEVTTQDRCGLCHPPASLPHFYLLGAPRDRVVDCTVCHPKSSFTSTATKPLVHVGHFDGSEQGECTQCHQVSTCRQCHATTHPAGWISQHGAAVGEDPTPCYTCHTGEWCTSRCHAVTSTNPFVPQPLPSTGVRP
jgi:hypothetical protein